MALKDIAAMKKELKGLKSTHARLTAAVEKMDAKRRELSYDRAKDKRMKKDLRKDIVKRAKKTVKRYSK